MSDSISVRIEPNISKGIDDPNMMNLDDLPFIGTTGKGNKKRRKFWDVKPTSDYKIDRIIGAYHALEALEYMRKTEDKWVLSSIIGDLPNCKDWSGIEDGFIEIITDYTLKGTYPKAGQ